MKKKFFFTINLLIIFYINGSKAQSSVPPFPEYHAVWIFDYYDFSNPWNPTYEIRHIRTCNIDTLINGRLVTEFYQYITVFLSCPQILAPPGFVPFQFSYFDSISNKVYLDRQLGGVPDTLLFDPSLQIGDTLPQIFHTLMSEQTRPVVIGIDSMQSGNFYRKVWHLDHNGNLSDYIEGIGTTYGIFQQLIPFERYTQLRCFIVNDTAHYPVYGDSCAFTISIPGIKYSLNDEIIIYPNPAKSSFSIKNNSNSLITIRQLNIYNMMGVKTYSKFLQNDNEEININELRSGIYIVELITDKGRRFLRRMVKE